MIVAIAIESSLSWGTDKYFITCRNADVDVVSYQTVAFSDNIQYTFNDIVNSLGNLWMSVPTQLILFHNYYHIKNNLRDKSMKVKI